MIRIERKILITIYHYFLRNSHFFPLIEKCNHSHTEIFLLSNKRNSFQKCIHRFKIHVEFKI